MFNNTTTLGFFVWCLAIFCPCYEQNVAQEQTAAIRPGDNLTCLNIPEIRPELAEAVRKYTEARAAAYLSWHPQKHAMLISTRFSNSNQVHLVEQPVGARYQLTFFSEPVGAAAFEPKNGDYFLFTKDVGGNEFAQIYRHDFSTGENTLLTEGGRSQNGGWRWNRNGDRICFTSTRRNGADRDIWLMNPRDKESASLLFELRGGGWSVQDWSPDDRTILIMEYLSVNKSNLYLGDLQTRRLIPINPSDANIAYGGARFSKDGKGLYLTTDEAGEFQQFAYMDLESKRTDLLTADVAWDVEAFELNHGGTRVALCINEAGVSQLFVMDVLSKQMRKVAGLPLGVISLGEWSHDDKAFSISMTSAQSSSDVYAIDAQSLEATRWTKSEMGGLISSDLRSAKLIEWKSFDERLISGFLFMPPSKFQGKRPVIINIHGGPEGQSRPIFQSRNNYFLNELGCAMIYPNVRGSVGYGKTFSKLDNGLLRLDSVKDIGSLLDWIKQSPDLDSNRIMVTGGSYGGYMTLACAVEYNDRIACSLDVVGISHFGTFLKNTESYRRDLRRVEYGDERVPEIAEFFEKMAPLNNAGRIKKPLFVVQGGNDPRVPLSEAEQMVAKVRANRGPVWYLMASDEGHGFRKKTNADFQFYATVLFVKQYLLNP
jgi:dipeptidyl aminopeptidase/acylaminoacyl peptidase